MAWSKLIIVVVFCLQKRPSFRVVHYTKRSIAHYMNQSQAHQPKGTKFSRTKTVDVFPCVLNKHKVWSPRKWWQTVISHDVWWLLQTINSCNFSTSGTGNVRTMDTELNACKHKSTFVKWCVHICTETHSWSRPLTQRHFLEFETCDLTCDLPHEILRECEITCHMLPCVRLSLHSTFPFEYIVGCILIKCENYRPEY